MFKKMPSQSLPKEYKQILNKIPYYKKQEKIKNLLVEEPLFYCRSKEFIGGKMELSEEF